MAEKDSVYLEDSYYILKNKVENLEKDNEVYKDLLLHYRDYFNNFHRFVLEDVIGSGLLNEEVWDELIDDHQSFGSIDYYSMLSHIDSIEKKNAKFLTFPFIKHSPHLKSND